MSNKNISVKVKVSVLIDALQKALAVREERFAKNEKTEADYKKAQEKWQADFMKLVIASVKNGKAKPESVTERSRWGNAPQDDKTAVVELTLNIPINELKKQLRFLVITVLLRPGGAGELSPCMNSCMLFALVSMNCR